VIVASHLKRFSPTGPALTPSTGLLASSAISLLRRLRAAYKQTEEDVSSRRRAACLLERRKYHGWGSEAGKNARVSCNWTNELHIHHCKCGLKKTSYPPLCTALAQCTACKKTRQKNFKNSLQLGSCTCECCSGEGLCADNCAEIKRSGENEKLKPKS
jgi:hypothetical protein